MESTAPPLGAVIPKLELEYGFGTVTVTVADPLTMVKTGCVEVAVIVALVGAARVEDEVKMPDGEIVPAFEGLTDKVTADICPPVPWTVAAHVLVSPALIDVGAPVTLTDVIVGTGGAVMVTLAVPDLVGSCALVTVIVALPELGTEEGALKRPELEIVPKSVAHVMAEL